MRWPGALWTQAMTKEVLSRNDRGSARADKMRRLIAERGLTLVRHGRCWRIVGPFTDLLIDDLSWLSARDFEPLRVRGEE